MPRPGPTGDLRDFNGNLFKVSLTDSFDNAFSAFDTWLAAAGGTNMSYMLSAQLAGMKLNVTMTTWNSFGGVNPNALIYAPGTNSANINGFAAVSAVMAEAAAELAKDPVNAKNSSNQYYQGAAGTMPSSMSGSPWGSGSAAVYNYAQALKDGLYNGNQNTNFVQSPVTMLLRAAGSESGSGTDDGVQVSWAGVLGGTYYVSILQDTGAIDDAEVARIGDAIAMWNTTMAPFGVNLVEVGADDDAAADIHVHLALTTVIGGVAEGVLGVQTSTTAGTEITRNSSPLRKTR